MTDPTPHAVELTDELDRSIASAAELLREAVRSLALTGAGMSVESGIPPFRGPGGLWTKYGEPPMDGYQRFLADPRRDWQERLSPKQGWARGLLEVLSQAKPNAGHRALAELERRGALACLITQNVDDLHGQAGSRSLLEIHGNYFRLRCIQCVARFREGELEIDPESLPPRCPRCGGIVKSDTVSFGEPIPPDVLRRCYEEVEQADCMLVAGTSATVYPAAEFPLEILRRGGTLIEVNPYETELTPLATLALCGPGASVLERLVHHLGPGRAE
jgi:NAD-dependent deacetylase